MMRFDRRWQVSALLLAVFGGSAAALFTSMSLAQSSGCDSAYPDVCIPAPPPDLDCGDISHRRFRVLQPDPHRFDGDKDGIGCEAI